MSLLISEIGKERDGGIVRGIAGVGVLVFVTTPTDGHFANLLEATIALFFHVCIRWLPALFIAFALFSCKLSFPALEVAADVLPFSFDAFESIESVFFLIWRQINMAASFVEGEVERVKCTLTPSFNLRASGCSSTVWRADAGYRARWPAPWQPLWAIFDDF